MQKTKEKPDVKFNGSEGGVPLITVVKEFTFDSAHYLPDYDGPCCKMHGHTYKLQVGIRGPINTETGMVCDFKLVSEIVKKAVALLDHNVLNEVEDPSFPTGRPTAEGMCVWFVVKVLGEMLSDPDMSHLMIDFVRLWETPTSYAEFYV